MSESTERGPAERLLADFPLPAPGAWEEAARRSLDGKPLESLRSETLEGIVLRPIYGRAETAGLAHVDSAPGAPPYVRGSRALGARLQPWDVAQILPYPEPAALAAALAHDLPRGLGAAAFALDRAGRLGLDADRAPAGTVGSGGVSLGSPADLAEVLAPVDLTTTPVRLCGGPSVLAAAALVVAHARERGVEPASLRGFVGFDPLAELAACGELPAPLERIYDELAALTRWAALRAPRLCTVAARAWPYHDGGADAVDELALTLAAAVEHLRRLTVRGLTVDQVAPHLEFGLAAGTHFFLELAKLRAARLLWARVVELSGGRSPSGRLNLHVRTSRLPLSAFDAPTNILRGTMGALAAVLGGCASLHVEPYDSPLGLPGEPARRLARNTQLMLREESHLDRVVDPAGGSWCVESLTDELAHRAWVRFQEVEAAGGLAAALGAGLPQRLVAETAARRRREVATGRSVLVGVNRYADPGEGLPRHTTVDLAAIAARGAERARAARAAGGPEAEAALAGLATVAGVAEASFEAAVTAAGRGATLGQLVAALREGQGPGLERVAPIPVFRAAREFEQLRRAVLRRRGEVEGGGATTTTTVATAAPSQPPADVHLANLGPPARHMPRLDFTRGFFLAGGLVVGGADAWHDEPGEAALAAWRSDAPIVCLVGRDETYATAVPAFLAALRELEAPPEESEAPGAVPAAAPPPPHRRARPHVMLAGRPAGADELAAAGVDEFLTARGDLLATLQGLARRLGALEQP